MVSASAATAGEAFAYTRAPGKYASAGRLVCVHRGNREGMRLSASGMCRGRAGAAAVGLAGLAMVAFVAITPRAEGASSLADSGYHAVTLLDMENPVSPAWLQQAGVDCVYVPAPPIETAADGAPVVAPSRRRAWEDVMRLYEGTGVHVLVMGNFYINPATEHEAVDAFGRRHPMACFRQPGFQAAMRERIVALAQALSPYPVFGGFVFDDGPHVRVDCCWCDRCLEQFRAQHGVEPPAFEPVSGTRRVRDDAPVLAWEAFQRESWEIYLRTQSQAVRSVSDDLLMLTIPSDSYFYGRFLAVDTPREESVLGHSGRLQRIERIQPREWMISQSFPLARVPEADERGLQSWAVGAHITADSPKMLMHCRGPYAPTYQRIRYMSPAEIERMARTSIVEGANSICYWTPAGPLPFYPSAFDAMAEVYRDVQQMEDVLGQRRRPQQVIGLLYSTTTETIEQAWRSNTAERWQHLHAFEGMAYSLRRCNIPFEIVMEEELSPERLRRLKALILPAVRFLTESAAAAIETAVAETGLRALAAGECVPLRGMIASGCDPMIWHTWASRGYRQEEYADEQWAEVRNTMTHHLLPLVEEPARVYSERAIGQLYEIDGGDLLLMIASWDLDELTEVAVEGPGRATDVLSGRELGTLDELGRLTIPPAGWRVLRVSQ